MPEGKIIKALSGFYYVLDGERVVQCRGRGIFRKRKVSPLVGDYVEYQADNDKEGTIVAIEDRKNEMIRPPIANVDQAILVFSAVQPDFSTALLDRFLVLIESKQIEPLICITKIDLLSEAETKQIQQYADEYRSIGYSVLLTSSMEEDGLEELLSYLHKRISVFAGQSGVGKSSLLNALRPELELKTNEISDSLGRGKHTTRHVELIKVNDGLVADTPGFSSLEFTEIEADELPFCFPEMVKLSQDCKFRGCLHLNEPKCAVKAAVEADELLPYRYKHYLQFMEEIKERKPRY
ncbi:ribosome biogenesis GTPase [Bacillus ectoiniformans]|uniref:ribosome small subunit-dependent GTPase A n=1 Tax=Bacillus ectoiniformans TaxID=1494429 RepID=UPI00195637EE|nr:ribosome small subunit-dependent GTPase A [Bacillus ectoiniformans]MBM7647176.1 ribosome biogenesis GTPase [Bacillus ectoiniformans]